MLWTSISAMAAENLDSPTEGAGNDQVNYVARKDSVSFELTQSWHLFGKGDEQ